MGEDEAAVCGERPGGLLTKRQMGYRLERESLLGGKDIFSDFLSPREIGGGIKVTDRFGTEPS